MALSRCPFPCFAAVNRANAPPVPGLPVLLDLGEPWVARRDGSERSVDDDELKVWENQPESLVGRLVSGTLLMGRSVLVLCLGMVTGSTMTGGSSPGSFSLSLRDPRNLLPFLGVFPGGGVLWISDPDGELLRLSTSP